MQKHGNATLYRGRFRRAAALLLGLLLLCAAVPCAWAEPDSGSTLQSAMQDIIDWKKREFHTSGALLDSDFSAGAGSSAADWFVIALARTGVADDYDSYLALLQANVTQRYRTPEKLDAQKATEWHRIAFVVCAAGGDPTQFGTDAAGQPISLLADGVYDRDRTAPLGAQGVNAYIWALIALDAANAEIPGGASATRETIIDAILAAQLSSGGFTLDGKNPDIDVTAMALQAFRTYQSMPRVAAATARALDYLSQQQNPDGGFTAWGQPNAESTAQVILALCALNIDPGTDARFIENGRSALDGLMCYRTGAGGFAHTVESAATPNDVASEQALCALCAVYRLRAGLPAFYDFSDARVNIFDGSTAAGTHFSESDLAEYRALPEPLTGAEASTVRRLWAKLSRADNQADYADVLNALTAKKTELDRLDNQVARINADIAEYLYPLDRVTAADQPRIRALLREIDVLSDYDQARIPARDELRSAQARLAARTRAQWIFAGVAGTLAVLLLIAALRFRKKRRMKKQEQSSEW